VSQRLSGPAQPQSTQSEVVTCGRGAPEELLRRAEHGQSFDEEPKFQQDHAVRGGELVGVINDKTPARADLTVWNRTYQVSPEADIVINATSIGLYPHIHGRLDIDLESLKPGMVVADVVPSPPRTNLIRDAEARGCTIVDGLGMLVNQGVISIKYWTGIDADAAVMRGKLEEIYGV